MTWSGRRRTELPSNWATLRLSVKRRARNLCEAEQHEPDCPGTGSECDHVGDKHDHSLANLRWLSTECHRAKTLQQAAEARAAIPKARRAPEKHPGLA